MTTQARAKDGLIPAVRGSGLLFDDPRPLVFSDRPVVIAWSPKSACTHVLTWYLAQENLLQAAEFFDPWPHRYRGNVYYRCIMYRQAATRLLDSAGAGHTLIRITRDPAKRLVSVFRHAMRTRMLQIELDSLLGRATAMTGVSIAELGHYLEQCDLVNPSTVNFHLCAQYHPVWDMAFDRVVTLNMDETPLEAGIAAIERDLGLPERRVSDLDYFSSIRERHYAQDVPHAGPEPIEDVRLGRPGQEGFPKAALEASQYVRALAARLHRVDLGRVASGDTAGRLFS